MVHTRNGRHATAAISWKEPARIAAAPEEQGYRQKAEQWIQDNPALSLCMAICLGAVTGWVIRRTLP